MPSASAQSGRSHPSPILAQRCARLRATSPMTGSSKGTRANVSPHAWGHVVGSVRVRLKCVSRRRTGASLHPSSTPSTGVPVHLSTTQMQALAGHGRLKEAPSRFQNRLQGSQLDRCQQKRTERREVERIFVVLMRRRLPQPWPGLLRHRPIVRLHHRICRIAATAWSWQGHPRSAGKWQPSGFRRANCVSGFLELVWLPRFEANPKLPGREALRAARRVPGASRLASETPAEAPRSLTGGSPRRSSRSGSSRLASETPAEVPRRDHARQPVDAHRARVHFEQPSERPNRRRLARSVRSHQTVELPTPNLERHSGKRCRPTTCRFLCGLLSQWPELRHGSLPPRRSHC